MKKKTGFGEKENDDDGGGFGKKKFVEDEQGFGFKSGNKSGFGNRTGFGGGGFSSSSTKPTCYNCGESGHLSRDCPKGPLVIQIF